MKIVIFAFLMVIVLTLVESHKRSGWRRGKVRISGHGGGDTRVLIRLKRDLNNKSVQRDLGSGQHRYPEDVKSHRKIWQEMHRP